MNSTWALICAVLSAIGWTLTYILVIRRNYLEKTYGIPVVALAVNVTWELIFSLLLRPATLNDDAWLWITINLVWLLLDVVILVQTIKYGVGENWPSKAFFYNVLTMALIFGLLGVLAVTFQFQDWEGRWTSFASNLMMSILFVNMLYQRGIRGQSIYIGFSKLIGTLAIGLGYLITDPTSLLQWYLTVSILFFDTLYLVLLFRKIRAAQVNPWTRF
jgi:phosphoglycerol transferase MdoB-like AlkP superfamily enzyme